MFSLNKTLTAFTFLSMIAVLSLTAPSTSYSFTDNDNWVQSSVWLQSHPSYSGIAQEEEYSESVMDNAVATVSGSIAGSTRYFWNYPTDYASVNYDASASAGAFASTGSLRVGAASEGEVMAYPDYLIDNWGAVATANAKILDTIRFPDYITESFYVDLSWNVNGAFNDTHYLAGAGTSVNYAIGGSEWFITGTNSPTLWQADVTGGTALFSQRIWINPNANAPSWAYLLPNAEWDPLELSIRSDLWATVYDGYANYMNTGSWSISVQDDIPFESSSGVFLSDTGHDPGPGPAPVPEPSTFILLGIGLAGLSFYARRQKQA